jgi:rare lipoprotein A
MASWFDAPDGTCAHRDLPLGTIVTVTRTATGASTTCRVSDRGPSLATNRVIDLSLDTFAKLASPDAGVIEVRIEW